VTVPLASIEAIARHLKGRGFEVMIAGTKAAVRARIADFNAHVELQFLSDRTLRIVCSVPVTVTDANRGVFALRAVEINRTGLGIGCIMAGRGIGIATRIPIEEDGHVSAIAVERAFALVVETASVQLPVLERIQKSGLAAV
jgi:hypothetical protein